MKKSHATKRKPLTDWSKAALRGCDWFVNSQIIQHPRNWDANNGRFMYNVHIPSRTSAMGIGWTQARAVMCLLAAYERTGDTQYLETAERGITYAKLLQNMDRRFSISYGAFHEETPQSAFSFPRDAIEVADALLLWHAVTGDKDALYRAELFFKWFTKIAVKTYPRFGYWVKGEVRFDRDKTKNRFSGPISCEMGCGTILAHAYYLTGKKQYKTMALKIADSMIENYLPANSTGPLMEKATGRLTHHTGVDGVIYNDDGGGISLLSAYKLSGEQKYMDAAIRIAEYFKSYNNPYPTFCSPGAVANFLLELDHSTGKRTYHRKALELARQTIKMQVNSGPKIIKGGFRGEDEGGGRYYKGAKNRDFVTTRVTAYSVLTLFKAEGVIWPRGYSTEF
ncbi:MAG: AGE family epimerase/isomerase [Kiritimatiellae bacterium]|nr:AGE family epimerase/isomerase [Kiritimatiellia bacterium]